MFEEPEAHMNAMGTTRTRRHLNRLATATTTGWIGALAALTVGSIFACTRFESKKGEQVAGNRAGIKTPGCIDGQHDGHDYLFCTDALTFEAARRHCQAKGLDLASVDSQAENDYVQKHVRANSYIGITDQAQEGDWKWIADGRLATRGQTSGQGSAAPTNTHPLHTDWAPEEPPEVHCSYQTRDDHAYWFCRDASSWDEARAACEGAGMQLAHMDDGAENDFISRQLTLDVWLGAIGLRGQWRWLEGNKLFWTGGLPGSAVGGAYANWKKGHPTNQTGSDCLAMDQADHGSWRSDDCNAARHGWVCKGKLAPEPQVPDVHDCALLRNSDGRWVAVECTVSAAYVCETPPPNAAGR